MNRRTVLIAAAIAIFAAQAISSRYLRRDPFLPTPPPLASFPLRFDGWAETREETIAPDALEMLGPDDFVARIYQHGEQPGGANEAELFVAYYKTQLRAKNAHDPKVCLPGAGWSPTESRLTSVSRDAGLSFPANYYRIKKNDSEQVVLYWFQTFKGVYTQEQQLSAHRVLDSLTDNRTDMALVRIMVPVPRSGVPAADATASRLAKVIYNQMLSYFPPTEKSRS